MSQQEHPDDQFVPEDDAVIGRAFRVSALVIAAIAAAGLTAKVD